MMIYIKPMRHLYRYFSMVLFISLLSACSTNTILEDLLDVFGEDNGNGDLTKAEIVLGLKEALSKGTSVAINSLGRKDGFYRNRSVKIRMPEKLQKAEELLRKLKQDEIVDEFILSMNRAAEKAVPEVTDIFVSAIRDMSFADARSILQGSDDSATRYFRRTSEQKLTVRIQPLVAKATDQAGVTARYKQMVDEIGIAANLVDSKFLDLDSYVTKKTIDGLFMLLAEQERLIREDPTARTSEILKKVFKQ